MKIIDMLRNSTELKPNATACISGNVTLTYSDLLTNVVTLENELKRIGCKEGVKVGAVLNNSIEYLISMFAVWAANCILVPLHKSMTVPEIEHVLKESDTCLVIAHLQYKKLFSDLIHNKQTSMIGIEYKPYLGIQITSDTVADICIDEENQDVAMMIPTSGSTGNPKIVMHRESSLLLNVQQFKQAMHFKGHHRVLVSVKFHHIYCICAQILTHISRNDTLIFDDTPFFAGDFLEKVKYHNISITALIPAMFVMVAAYPGINKYKTLPLEIIICAGAKTPQQHINKMKQLFPKLKFVNAYGLTEAGPRVSLTCPEECFENYESAGKCISGVDIKIIGGNGEELDKNQIGEIFVKSPAIMKGYYKRPDLTQMTILNGWLRTGDMGKRDKDSNLIIIGRQKEVINSGGDNIYPAEIEECIMKHPSVDKVAVIKKSDIVFNEVPCAFIVLRKTRKLTKLDIIKWCKSYLSSYKIPRDVIFINEMPLLSTFKYDKKRLAAMLEESQKL